MSERQNPGWADNTRTHAPAETAVPLHKELAHSTNSGRTAGDTASHRRNFEDIVNTANLTSVAGTSQAGVVERSASALGPMQLKRTRSD